VAKSVTVIRRLIWKQEKHINSNTKKSWNDYSASQMRQVMVLWPSSKIWHPRGGGGGYDDSDKSDGDNNDHEDDGSILSSFNEEDRVKNLSAKTNNKKKPKLHMPPRGTPIFDYLKKQDEQIIGRKDNNRYGSMLIPPPGVSMSEGVEPDGNGNNFYKENV
jgi:hypothetical protein